MLRPGYKIGGGWEVKEISSETPNLYVVQKTNKPEVENYFVPDSTGKILYMGDSLFEAQKVAKSLSLFISAFDNNRGSTNK